ncbi:MAG: hypothetical protein CVV41_05245 [Candidatus Riflebacteria bacterium HGW-Riflebacteria-1]|jgi:prepilin-type N-terminal cleavage/methylation domain-containing protein|nr:MAG: hypothetical protein CVV41_05245 [Candidatus Riflebacteria bacterium HGW-Riflebacteria-1]
MTKKHGFTLVEIIIVAMIISMVSGVAYKLMSGTFSQYFKSQTKLTNLRAASIILERIKADVRLALIPVKPEENPVIEEAKIAFCITDEGQRRMVNYTYNPDNGMVTRDITGGLKRVISLVKVGGFKINELGEGDSKLLAVTIMVDNEKDVEQRSDSSINNQVELKAVMYPRFFAESLSNEEKFWNLARSSAGGTL